MGIEGEHRDPGFAHRKVSDQATAQAAQRGQYLLLGHRTTHLFERDMDRYQSHFQQVAAHHHQRLAAELCGEEFGVTRKIESGLMPIFLADRRGHPHIDRPRLQIGGGGLQRGDRGLPRFGGQLSRLDAQLARCAVDQVNPSGISLRRFPNNIEVEILGILHLAPVKSGGFRRTVNHRRAQLAHPRIEQ